MLDEISLPLWLVTVLFLLSGASLYHYFFAPIAQWLIQNQERQVNEKLENNLSRKPPDIFKLNRRTRIDLFYNHPGVKNLVDTEVAKNNIPRKEIEARVRTYITEMTPGFSALFYFHIGYYISRAYLRLLYDLRIAKQPPSAINNIPENASIVLVGNHRSNIDVMILAYLSARTSMVSFAAGEWAKQWPMSSILHLCGSYIIRRDSSDPLYRQILKLHLEHMVEERMPQGIFLEGGLTRDGSMQPIKLGLLSYILKNLEKKSVHDIVFIPVAFNYDQVPEDKTLLQNQNCGFDDKSQFYALLSTSIYACKLCTKAIRLGKSAYGKAAISFGEPLHMKQWLLQNNLSMDTLTSEQCKSIVTPVGDSLMTTIREIIPILPVSVVSTVFVKNQQTTLTEMEVKGFSASIIKQLRKKNSLAFNTDEEDQAIEHGLKVLLARQVISENNKQFSINQAQIKLLYYYYNSTAHLLEF